MMSSKLRIVLGTALLFVSVAAGQVTRNSWLGSFSNAKYIPDTGDVVGIEILVIPGSENKIFVLFQEMEGEFGNPHLVQATMSGGKLRFAIDDGGPMRFEATLNRDGMTLVRERAPEEEIILSRGRSYLLDRR
jgi:hypothetical protein